MTPQRKAAHAFEPLKRLRDEVMHLVRALLTIDRTVDELVRLDRDLHRLVKAAAGSADAATTERLLP